MSDNTELDWSDVDPDLLMLTNYFAGELSQRDLAEVENRVVHDDAFFGKVELLIKAQLLVSPVPYRGMRAALVERKERIAEDHLADLVDKWAWPDIDRRLAEPMPTFDAPRKTDSSVTPIEPRLKADNDGQRWWAGYASAASRVGDRIAVAAVVLSLLGSGVLYLKVQSIAAALDGKKPTGISTWPLAIEVVNVAPGAAPRVVELPRGIRATVMPGSRISFDTASFSVLFASSVFVKLDGEASFEVPPQARLLRMITPAAELNLKDGDFAVRSSDRGYETLITVSRGQARVRRINGPPDEVLDVTSGFVRVARTQKPALVTEGTDKFPKVPPR